MLPVKKRSFRTPDFADLLNLPRMVVNPLRNRLQFIVESMLLSGTSARLAVAAGLIALVAVLMGLAAYFVAGRADASVSNPLDAIWWAFLRLSDPGYLGDDKGVGLRIVSTLVTLAGYVLFLGVLVAVLTQGLNELIRRLERGLTPISARNHVILLGWPNRLPGIVRNLLISEQRVIRFLRRLGARRLRLVLLVEEVSPQHSAELRAYLGRDWRAGDIILRSGSPLRLDHLRRVDYLRAASIVVPAGDRSTGQSASQSDNAAIKTLLAISHSMRLAAPGRTPPMLVAELYDARKIPVALHSYAGPIEVVAGDEVVSRMVAQMVRHPQISRVFRELLTPSSGNEIFARDCPAHLAGTPFWALAECWPKAILIGLTRPADSGIRPLLDPPADTLLQTGDKLVYIARDWEDGTIDVRPATPKWPAPGSRPTPRVYTGRRVLVLGWSRRVPALLAEFESYTQQEFEVVIVSRMDGAQREREIADYGLPLARVKVFQVASDYTVPERLIALNPTDFDTVLVLASDMADSDEEADARTIVAHAVLRDILPREGPGPRVLLELLDELNAALVATEECEYLLSPHILNHILVQVALRRELNAVFQELFNSGETEIGFRDPAAYGLSEGTRSFAELQAKARSVGDVALGVFKVDEINSVRGGIHLNPPRDSQWPLTANDRLVVLSR